MPKSFTKPVSPQSGARVPALEPSAPPVDVLERQPRRYRVTVDCPTPLAANPLLVEAETEQEAWRQFCLANGIAGTDRPVTIEEQ